MEQVQKRPGIERPLTVTELNHYIKNCLEHCFPSVWLSGELADINFHQSSHLYFILKDSQCQIHGVSFRFAEIARQMGLCRGMAVEVFGTVSVFESRGEYQINAVQIRPMGSGELNRQLEELKAKLAAEGLFDPARKRPIPTSPKIIGLITAATGAAIQDFLKNLACPIGGMHVRFIPSLVQGKEAPQKLKAAVEYLNQTHACDVIVITRGGGATEDLSAFNDETLVRTIAASEIPVISAIGHDRDLSLCDYAADLAVSTPTAAASSLVRAKLDFCRRLETASRKIHQIMQNRLFMLRQRYERLASCPYLSHPEGWLHQLAQRLDYIAGRLGASLPNLALRHRASLENVSNRLKTLPQQLLSGRKSHLEVVSGRLASLPPQLLMNARGRLERCSAMLKVLDPHNVMIRGYSILLDANGHAIRNAEDVACGDELKALLANGELTVNVIDKHNQE
ncbi:MAG: exodeoxyribonuclease VII large subunit [Victivallales bacterium]|nr:exodeoxyribonuclease VII large subunit [Victivallales bacterium]